MSKLRSSNLSLKRIKNSWFLNVTLRDKTDPYLGPLRRRKLKGTDFTIISNNCWGGHVYRWYALPYQSPTIGLYFWADEYLKLVSDLRHYIEAPLEFIPASESRNYEDLQKKGHLHVPIGLIDDIEIVFLHYKTEEEAREKWERRCRRVNWDHILVKNSYIDRCTDDIKQAFLALDLDCKLFFQGKDTGEPNTVFYRNDANEMILQEDSMFFYRFFDLTGWINSSYK